MANNITGTYRNGSSGEEVRKIQQALIDAGYDVGKTKADGVFGKNTLAAVKQYQKDNGLAVDGIVGKNTIGSLFNQKAAGDADTGVGGLKTKNPVVGGVGNAVIEKPVVEEKPSVEIASANPSAPVTSPSGFTYGDFSYDSWNPNDDPVIQQANELLQQHMANQVGEYTPVWQETADSYLSQYQNRDPFSYDFNSDALYNQYKDQYIQQGRLAMMDTMGQAAAMTGGYGNSYAQTVGQQAYNQQLNQLNEVMPELYGMAYDRYNQEGQDLLNMYGMYMDREAMAYSQHQDALNNWYKQLDYLTDSYNTAYNRGYDDYLLGYNAAWDEYSTDRAEEFEKWQTQQSQEFTASENEKSRNWESSEAEKDRTWKESQTTTSSTGSNEKEVKYNTLDYEQQQKWGKEFEKAVAAKSISDVDSIADRMVDAGFDPQIVARWRDTYAEKITGKTEKYLSGEDTPTSGVGGGGGGKAVWMIK